MFAHRLRSFLAIAVASAGALVLAPPALAEGATITSPQPGKFSTQEPLRVAGTCPQGSRTAMVAVASDDVDVTRTATDVSDDLGFATVLDISKALTGTGRVSVACFAYSEQAPLGTAEVEVFLFGPDTADYEVEVSVSPHAVALGGTLTVSATCERGTQMAVVYLQSDFEGSFLPGDGFIFRQATLTPSPNGDVVARLPISADPTLDFSDPEVGPARAQVLCGDPEAEQPVREGLGEARFVITAPASPRPPGTLPGPAQELANTGSDVSHVTGMAALLLVAGLAMSVAIRGRPAPASRRGGSAHRVQR